MPGHPWSLPIQVAVEPDDDDRLDYEQMVMAGCMYWGLQATCGELDDAVAFELVKDTTGADVVVRFVEQLSNAPNHAHSDAPAISRERVTVSPPEHVRVETGFTAASTWLLVAHELGHILGLADGDEPEEIMALAKHHSLDRARGAGA